MITALPSPPVASRPALRPVDRRGRADRSWQLLTAGDEVSIGDGQSYTVIHLAEGRAWVSALADGTNRLVEAAILTLVRPAGAAVLGRA